MIMIIRQIEAFKAVMELGSFTRAAEKLHLSQPAVSKLVAVLEDRCGFPLFLRQKNGVIPTPEGEMLFQEVDRVFTGVEAIAARARAIGCVNHGEINMVAFPSLATRVLPRILAPFLASRPGLRLTLGSRNSWLLVDRVATQGVDVGFGMLQIDRPGVEFAVLCQMDAVCVLPLDHPLASEPIIHAAMLKNERLVTMVNEDRAQARVDEVLHRHDIRSDSVIKVQLTEAICTLVAAKAGIAIVDPLSASGFRADELVVRPFAPRVRQTVWTVTPAFRPTSLATRALITHVGKELSALLAECRDRWQPPDRS